MLKKLIRTITEPFRRSIRNKLILTMIILSVVPIIAVTGLAAENNRKSMETEVITTNLSKMKWTGVYLGDQFTQMNNIIYSVLISPHISEYLANVEEVSLSSQFTAQKNIMDTLTNLFYSAGNQVVGVELYLADPSKLFTINASQNDIETVGDIPAMYKPLIELNQDFMILTDSDDREQFQLIRSINRFENQQKLGAISLKIKWSMLDQTLELIGREQQQQVLIAGADGSILYQPVGEAPSEEIMVLVRETEDEQGYFQMEGQYVFFNTIDPVGLKLITIIPNSFINKSALETMKFGIIIGAISAAVSVLMAILLAWRTATPIVSLARSMQGLGLIKETEVRLSNRVDEIGLLEMKLYNMSSRIKEHIKTEYSINLEKKTAELKALQAQINPHFLQNTLQMIGSMLFVKKPAECYEIIRSLSEMFRYVIRDPDDLARVKPELDHLNHYMRIQQQRFGARLQYTLETDEALLNCPIPKLTLQPIVENAFIHGLDMKSGQWQVHVKVYAEQEAVCIHIRDNGVGMNTDKLNELRRRLDNSGRAVWTHGSSIGIQNVATRIRMHFGPAYGVTVESRQDQGTAVTVRIPVKLEEENDESIH